MIRTHPLLLFSIFLLCNIQGNAMDPTQKQKKTLPRKSQSLKKKVFTLTFESVGKKYISNRIESLLIAAVRDNDAIAVQEFFEDNVKPKSLRVDGCIMALHMALEKKHQYLEGYLISQPLIQNLLTQDYLIGLNKLFTLCAKYKYNKIVKEILTDQKKFENIDGKSIGKALRSIINNADHDLVNIILDHQRARCRLKLNDLQSMLFLASDQPYYEKITALIAEKKVKI